ncbi:hypothetical protein [Kribbella qitaiheensis]|nr:hypothetical protein [Kribbella qitaiheensis]
MRSIASRCRDVELRELRLFLVLAEELHAELVPAVAGLAVSRN